jgi:hypothetical protein
VKLWSLSLSLSLLLSLSLSFLLFLSHSQAVQLQPQPHCNAPARFCATRAKQAEVYAYRPLVNTVQTWNQTYRPLYRPLVKMVQTYRPLRFRGSSAATPNASTVCMSVPVLPTVCITVCMSDSTSAQYLPTVYMTGAEHSCKFVTSESHACISWWRPALQGASLPKRSQQKAPTSIAQQLLLEVLMATLRSRFLYCATLPFLVFGSPLAMRRRMSDHRTSLPPSLIPSLCLSLPLPLSLSLSPLSQPLTQACNTGNRVYIISLSGPSFSIPVFAK